MASLAGKNAAQKALECGVAMMRICWELFGVEMVLAAWNPDTVLPESWAKKILNIVWPRPSQMPVFLTQTRKEEPWLPPSAFPNRICVALP